MSGIDISAHHWFALRARPNREFKAAAELQARGLVTAVPVEWRKRRRTRHSRSVMRWPHAEISSYVITGFPTAIPPWRRLFEDPQLATLISGVVSVTGDGHPTQLRPKAIFKLQMHYGMELYEVPPKSRGGFVEENDLKEGDQARIGQWVAHWSREPDEFDEGGFAGKVVTIKEISGDMAKVLMPMFGIDMVVPIPLERLASAA